MPDFIDLDKIAKAVDTESAKGIKNARKFFANEIKNLKSDYTNDDMLSKDAKKAINSFCANVLSIVTKASPSDGDEEE